MSGHGPFPEDHFFHLTGGVGGEPGGGGAFGGDLFAGGGGFGDELLLDGEWWERKPEAQ